MTFASDLAEEPMFTQTEEDRILSWRLERLEHAGFSGEVLITLAFNYNVDLSAAEALLARGCSVQTAARILE